MTARDYPVLDARLAPAGSSADERIIRARGITRSFKGRIALHPTDLDLGPGGICALLGPNGSGKSTLLRVLTGLVRPDAGEARVAGIPLSGDGTAIRQRCTYAPGEIALYGEMKAREHLEWFLHGRERSSRARAVAIAGELGLPLQKRVRAYSHGMKRQLMLAAALAPEVPVRILDEATEGLDPSKRTAVLELLRADAERGTTILLSSHHLGEVDRVCDRLVFMNEGRKIADESAAEFRARARRFVHLAFDERADMTAARAILELIGGARIHVDGARVSAEIQGDDPRQFLAAACRARDLPQPRTIEYGEMSLSEIYRDLYGIEGC